MSDVPRLSEMHAETEQNLIDFLQADLALCTTFADLVLTELSLEDWQAAQSALAKSEEGYARPLHDCLRNSKIVATSSRLNSN